MRDHKERQSRLHELYYSDVIQHENRLPKKTKATGTTFNLFVQFLTLYNIYTHIKVLGFCANSLFKNFPNFSTKSIAGALRTKVGLETMVCFFYHFSEKS